MSSKADDFNRGELAAGRLTAAHISALVEEFQKANGLNPDAKAGKDTRALLDDLVAIPVVSLSGAIPTPAQFSLANPLPTLADGRTARLTSAFQSKDRPDHNGVDLFYRWKAGDKPDFVGDKGCATKLPDGTPKWVIPYGTTARASAPGVVQLCGPSPTGFRVWIDHDGNGLRTGYFHLLDLAVGILPGVRVATGDSLGLVGDNPKDRDARHLHFELSPVGRYAPIDPAPYLKL